MYFFTADEHFGHRGIIGYCDRPFSSVEEMDREIIRRHNEVIGKKDTVIHVGDFTLRGSREAADYALQLNGRHVFLRGSHDAWLPSHAPLFWEETLHGQHIFACHYAMRSWPKSQYGSWQLHGHSHGRLSPMKGQWDVGVDNNDFRPVSCNQLRKLLKQS